MTLCVLLVLAAVSLVVIWILFDASNLLPLVIGIVLFALIIAGIIIFNVFLVVEIRRNEDHDTFINAVTHELKTPIACITRSIRCSKPASPARSPAHWRGARWTSGRSPGNVSSSRLYVII